MARKFMPFSLPELSEEEVAEVVDSLRSGWITTGTKTKRFEADFAQYLGSVVEALAVNFATAGLHLVMEIVGIGSYLCFYFYSRGCSLFRH